MSLYSLTGNKMRGDVDDYWAQKGGKCLGMEVRVSVDFFLAGETTTNEIIGSTIPWISTLLLCPAIFGSIRIEGS